MLVASGMAAQKTMVVHKKDGTKVGINMDGDLSVRHFGKSVNADDDYVQILSFTGDKSAHSIRIKVDEDLTHVEEYGVVWSTLAGVTLDGNAILAVSDGDSAYSIQGALQLYKPYYYRAYVKKAGNYYYSSEQSHVFLPFMEEETGYAVGSEYVGNYAIPTEEAFKALAGSYGVEADTAMIGQLTRAWRQWATPEKVAAISKDDAVAVRCEEGTLYRLNAVPADFASEALGGEGTFSVEVTAYNADYTQYLGVIDTIFCDKSLGLKDNRYFALQPQASPNIIFGLDMPRNLPGYVQEIHIVFAPETRDGVTPLGTMVRGVWVEKLNNDKNVILNEAGGSSKSVVVDNAEKTDTLVFTYEGCKDFSSDVFLLQGRVSTVQANNGLYTKQMRIAEVYVTRRKAAL